MQADLHTHSTASDGQLSPTELVREAAAAGVETLAITDHDTLDGIASVFNHISDDIKLIPGLELSANWRKSCVHVVGLNVALDNHALLRGVERQQQARATRALEIAAKLERAGFDDVLQGAQKLAGKAPVGRPHFARYMVDSGQIRDVKTAFKKYLGHGKACDIRNCWASLEDVIDWIGSAGGIAVLAHPAKYKLSNLRLEELCKEFVAAGGSALEVVSGAQDSTLTSKLARLADRHRMLASCGSDFHQPGQPWAELGRAQPLPANCRPVWEYW